MRLAFCVQRYGPDVAGGAEALCRRTARALVDAGDEVVVYTTDARDYLTWEPHYPGGVSDDQGVEVRRFTVDAPDPVLAAELVRGMSLVPGGDDAERRWAIAQGPVSPAMLTALRNEGTGYDAVVFWTYLYATTQLGLASVTGRAVLVPLAHDEPMLRFALSRGLTRLADGIAFMTSEEALLVDDMHGVPSGTPWEIVGTGVDPVTVTARDPRANARPYVLYLGRIDPAKGVLELVDFHRRYRAAGGRMGLVLAGRPTVALDLPDWVRCTGFVDDSERLQLLADARVVALPSRYESLSLVALEAWQAGRPTLATEACEVTVGQTYRSGGGLTYASPAEYAARLEELCDPTHADALGASGRAWVADLTWNRCVERWHQLLHRVTATAE